MRACVPKNSAFCTPHCGVRSTLCTLHSTLCTPHSTHLPPSRSVDQQMQKPTVLPRVHTQKETPAADRNECSRAADRDPCCCSTRERNSRAPRAPCAALASLSFPRVLLLSVSLLHHTSETRAPLALPHTVSTVLSRALLVRPASASPCTYSATNHAHSTRFGISLISYLLLNLAREEFTR